jgi:hypothetical protein
LRAFSRAINSSSRLMRASSGLRLTAFTAFFGGTGYFSTAGLGAMFRFSSHSR